MYVNSTCLHYFLTTHSMPLINFFPQQRKLVSIIRKLYKELFQCYLPLISCLVVLILKFFFCLIYRYQVLKKLLILLLMPFQKWMTDWLTGHKWVRFMCLLSCINCLFSIFNLPAIWSWCFTYSNFNHSLHQDFFGKPAFLTVSGQLNAETYATALSDVHAPPSLFLFFNLKFL